MDNEAKPIFIHNEKVDLFFLQFCCILFATLLLVVFFTTVH